ncbi:MAG: hypothetical protein ACYDCL_22040 [Myxococcales bacterium]
MNEAFTSPKFNMKIENMPGQSGAVPTTNTFSFISALLSSQYIAVQGDSTATQSSVSFSVTASQAIAAGTFSSSGSPPLDASIVVATNTGSGLYGFSEPEQRPGTETLTISSLGNEAAGADEYPCAHGELKANLNNNDDPSNIITGTPDVNF